MSKIIHHSNPSSSYDSKSEQKGINTELVVVFWFSSFVWHLKSSSFANLTVFVDTFAFVLKSINEALTYPLFECLLQTQQLNRVGEPIVYPNYYMYKYKPPIENILVTCTFKTNTFSLYFSKF